MNGNGRNEPKPPDLSLSRSLLRAPRLAATPPEAAWIDWNGLRTLRGEWKLERRGEDPAVL